MKILLIVKSMMMEVLGPMYLSAVIKKSGHECKTIDISKAFEYALKWEPDIIGYSIMTGDQEKFKALNSRLKEEIKFKSIVGNCDPTFFPEGYDWADMVIKGEAESSILFYLANGIIHPNDAKFETIDDLPWPDRTDFPNFKVRDFITSRGCPYSCNYCYNHQWAEMFPEQKGVRVRNVDDVIAEIKSTDPEYVYFQDSCFGVNMDWFREFAEKYGKGGNVRLGTPLDTYLDGYKPIAPYQCNFRPEQINSERGELLRSSGCVAVRMALESATNRLRSLIGRNTVNLKSVREAVEVLKYNEIQVMLQNIIGLPTSTIEDDLFTLEMNIKYRPTYAWVSIFQPYPGTALGNWCKKEGLYSGDYSEIGDSFFETSVLNFDPLHKERIEVLQKVFALCVDKEYMPDVSELTYKNLPGLVHKIMRKECDRKLYLGCI